MSSSLSSLSRTNSSGSTGPSGRQVDATRKGPGSQINDPHAMHTIFTNQSSANEPVRIILAGRT